VNDTPQCGQVTADLALDLAEPGFAARAFAPVGGRGCGSGTFATIAGPMPVRLPGSEMRPPQILQVSLPPCGGMRLAEIEYFS